MFLGIEIGGTKLQLALGHADGRLHALWRGPVRPAEGGAGLRQQILTALPELLATARLERSALRGVGIGFGGPTDDATQSIITSHQVAGWNGFPLGRWMGERLGLPTALGNDADTAGLGEALFGAGRGLSPVFYVTVGSGIGGGLIVDGDIYRGVGKGAAEIGHLIVSDEPEARTVEQRASGWGIERAARTWAERDPDFRRECLDLSGSDALTAKAVTAAAAAGQATAQAILGRAIDALATGLTHVVTLLCPRRIVIGGGVSLCGEALFFEPLRNAVRDRTFPPFAGLTDIVPAALGEEVVLHGALALARTALRT